jgi:hypothetical protein
VGNVECLLSHKDVCIISPSGWNIVSIDLLMFRLFPIVSALGWVIVELANRLDPLTTAVHTAVFIHKLI